MNLVGMGKGEKRIPKTAWRTAAMLGSLVAMVLTSQAGAQSNSIVANIGGLRSDKGQVKCALFASAKDFPKNVDKALAQTQSSVENGRAVCEFRNVAPGRYAISVFHDENSNGKMDTNFIGMPREGVGASNNAIGHFGPPKFDAAAFSYSGGRLELAITMVYL